MVVKCINKEMLEYLRFNLNHAVKSFFHIFILEENAMGCLNFSVFSFEYFSYAASFQKLYGK